MVSPVWPILKHSHQYGKLLSLEKETNPISKSTCINTTTALANLDTLLFAFHYQ